MEAKTKRSWTNVEKGLFGIILFFAVIIVSIGGLVSDETPAAPTPAPGSIKSDSPPVSEADKLEAQKELDSLMDLAKTANLVESYEFSERASVVYAGPVWYTETVTFKKDFLAKIATLKKQITGYHRFEVRDALSDEKVGEVTSFSGALEIYK